MGADYCIAVKSRTGVTQFVLTGAEHGFLRFSCHNEVNGPGLLIFETLAEAIPDSDVGILYSYMEQDSQVELWRWDDDNDIDPYLEFEGLFVDEERFADQDGTPIHRAICRGYLDFLARAIVAFPDNEDDKSLFEAKKASFIMRNLVLYNATSSATTGNDRLRNTDLTNISVEADDDDGEVMTFSCAKQPLLEALQEVARIGDRDFYLTKTGAQAWEFRTDNYLGDNRSDEVTFALNYGNMANPVLQRNRLNEKTVAIVGGPGEDDGRTFVIRTGANYNASYNSKEVFYPATEYDTTAGLEAAGDVRLDELRAKDDLTWESIQTPGCAYGKHYFIGDLITGYYQDVTAVKQITGVSVSYSPGSDRAETIQIVTENI